MANLWDDIAKTIREGVDTVVEKTEELTKIGKIKVDVINIKRNVEKNFSELGGKVYHLIAEGKKTQIASDKEVKELIECIKILENELQDKNIELKKIKSKDKVKREEAAETKPASPPKAKSKPKPVANKESEEKST